MPAPLRAGARSLRSIRRTIDGDTFNRNALAAETSERGRAPILLIDEAHIFDHSGLDAIRLLTNHELCATTRTAPAWCRRQIAVWQGAIGTGTKLADAAYAKANCWP